MNQWILSARADLEVSEIVNIPSHNYDEDYRRYCLHCNRHTESFMKDQFRCRNCFRDKPKRTEIEKVFQELWDNNIEKIFQSLRRLS